MKNVPTIARYAQSLDSRQAGDPKPIRFGVVRKPKGWSLRQVRAASRRQENRSCALQGGRMPMQRANRHLFLGCAVTGGTRRWWNR